MIHYLPPILLNYKLIGTVITAFGIALFALALRRKHLRIRVQGLQKFAITDRASFSKNTESSLQKLGFILVLTGIITITIVAYNNRTKLFTDIRNER